MTANAPTLSPEARSVIEGVRELLREPTSLTGVSLALNDQGEHADPTTDAAVCWCLYGALWRVTYETGTATRMDAERSIKRVAKQMFGTNLLTRVTDMGHAAVMRLLAVALGEDDPGVES